MQRFHQFLYCGFSQMRVCRVRHATLCSELHTQCSLRSAPDLVLSWLTINQKLRTGSMTVRFLRTLTVALFSYQKEQADFGSLTTQRFSSRNLCSDNSLGIAGTTTVDLLAVFGRRNKRRDRVHMR